MRDDVVVACPGAEELAGRHEVMESQGDRTDDVALGRGALSLEESVHCTAQYKQCVGFTVYCV